MKKLCQNVHILSDGAINSQKCSQAILPVLFIPSDKSVQWKKKEADKAKWNDVFVNEFKFVLVARLLMHWNRHEGDAGFGISGLLLEQSVGYNVLKPSEAVPSVHVILLFFFVSLVHVVGAALLIWNILVFTG